MLMLLLGAQAFAANGPIPGPPRQLTDARSLVSPTNPEARPASVNDLMSSRETRDAVWSADGRDIFLTTNLTGRMNIWKMPADGGFPVQLTQSDNAQSGLAVSPDGRWLAFRSDDGGKEIFDIFAVPADGGQVINLTASDDWSEVGAVFSRDSKQLAFSRRGKQAPSFNIAVMDVASRKVRQLTNETSPNRSWGVVAFSADGRSLYANRQTVDQSGSGIYRIDIASGKATALTKDDGIAFNVATDVSQDGRLLALTTQNANGDLQAAVINLGAGNSIKVAHPDAWEQRAFGLSPDGKSLLISSNTNGRDSILRYDTASGTTRPLPMPEGMNSDEGGSLPAWSPDGRSILTLHESGNQSPDYWVLDATSGKARQLTRLALAHMQARNLPPTQIVNYPSSDGTTISAVLWMPFNLKRDGSAPAVVMPHGGPTWQLKDRFDATALALASRGYIVIAPNPRGSTGYGRAFREGNRMDLGGMDLQDEVAAAKFLVDSGYVDSKRIGITGGSYGGYMTLMALGRTPDVWAAGVAQYGIVNWYTMWENGSPQLRFYQKSLIGEPVKDKATYDAASPMTYMHQVRAPLLVLQGDNDLRVPKEQAVQVVDMLKKDGKTVDAAYYADEGHGFHKRETQIDALERTIQWFDKYLKAAPAR